jgi:hypothetical protein
MAANDELEHTVVMIPSAPYRFDGALVSRREASTRLAGSGFFHGEAFVPVNRTGSIA